MKTSAFKPPVFATDVGRRTLYLGVLLAVAAVLALRWGLGHSASHQTIYQPASRFVEPEPMCPWREPEVDLHRFFPGASHYATETKILSGKRVELRERLGRMPTSAENSLQVHRVFANGQPAGAVLTSRVKGEHGSIEIVLAVNTTQRVRGVRLQRLREPDPQVQALQDPVWLGSLIGKGAEASWKLGKDVPDLPGAARFSAEAILEAVRTLLILLAIAEEQTPGQAHH